MRKINLNELLKNPKFNKDKYQFHLFYKMLGEDSLFLSDNETYCLGRIKIGFPTWIWTEDNLNLKIVKEVEEILNNYYLISDNNKLTCKKELYEYLQEDLLGLKDYFEMGFLQCEKLNPVNLAKGYLDKPNYGDKITLARFWQDNCKELDGEEVSFEEALETVDYFLNDEKFYVWRNSEGKAVSMGCYTVTENQAKISHVFTDKAERCHGYCTSLVYMLTEMILADGLVPLLYTNHNYEASNRAYEKVGYEEKAILVNFTAPRQEKDNKK